MSDDLDFDMEVVGDDELNEMGADGASSSETDPRSTARDTERENTSSNHSEIEAVKSDQQKGHSSGLSPEASSADQKGNTSLSEFTAELLTGGRPKGGGNDEGDYVSIGGTQVSSGGQLEFEDLTYISEDYFPKVKDTQLRRHDILIVKDGSNTGDVALSWRDHADVVTNEHLFTLRLNAGLNAPFASYFLQSHEGWKQLKGVITGSAQLGLTKDFVSKVDVPELPLPEQRKIASVLYAVDQAIQKTEAIIEQAKRVKRGLMKDLFRNRESRVEEDPLVGKYPASWSIHDLGDVTEVVDAEHFTPDYTEEGFPVIRPGDLERGYISLDDVSKRVDKDTYQELIRRHRPTAEDIVYSRSQNFAVASQVLEGEPYCIGQDMVVVQSEGLETSFLLHLLNSPLVHKQAMRMATGSTFQRVNLGDIKSFKVPIPDEKTQRQVGITIDELERKSLSEEKSLRILRHLKKSLMQDLLTGEVRTADKAIDVLDEVVEHG